MKKKAWKSYLRWVLATEAVGLLSAPLTREGTELYKTQVIKPALSPPASLFPIVWALLYALMGIGAARISLSPESGARTGSLRLYWVQLFFNFFWSILFFNYEAFGASFFWLVLLWALIVWMTLSFREIDRPAAALQIPYLLWVAFAGYLNFGVWMLNR